MNHVILFLWPLKMKDWLLCWIKSSTPNRINFAREYTLSLSSPLRSKERGMSDMSAFNINAVLSFLAGSCLKVTVSCAQKTLCSFPTNRDHKIGLHITECCTEPEHTDWCCWLLHFIIIYLWKCISRVRWLQTKDIAQILKKHRRVGNANCWVSCCYQITFSSEPRYWTLLSNAITSGYIK